MRVNEVCWAVTVHFISLFASAVQLGCLDPKSGWWRKIFLWFQLNFYFGPGDSLLVGVSSSGSGGRLLHDGERFRSRKGFRRFLMKPKSFALFFLEPVSLCFHADNRLLISADELAILYNSAVVFFILENLWISFGKKISLVICLRKNQRRKSFQEIFICF